MYKVVSHLFPEEMPIDSFQEDFFLTLKRALRFIEEQQDDVSWFEIHYTNEDVCPTDEELE